MKSAVELVPEGAGFTKVNCAAAIFAEWQGRVEEKRGKRTGILRQGGDRFEDW